MVAALREIGEAETIGKLDDDCMDIVIEEMVKSGWAGSDSGKNFVMYPNDDNCPTSISLN